VNLTIDERDRIEAITQLGVAESAIESALSLLSQTEDPDADAAKLEEALGYIRQAITDTDHQLDGNEHTDKTCPVCFSTVDASIELDLSDAVKLADIAEIVTR